MGVQVCWLSPGDLAGGRPFLAIYGYVWGVLGFDSKYGEGREGFRLILVSLDSWNSCAAALG